MPSKSPSDKSKVLLSNYEKYRKTGFAAIDMSQRNDLGFSFPKIDTKNLENRKDSEEDLNKLAQRCLKEYKISKDYIRPFIEKNLGYLKLYNNQRKDPSLAGSDLLFTSFQTVLASLYSDELSVEFSPKESGDIETAANLTTLAKNDYDLMQKAQVDFDWDFDTCFFGDGYLLFEKFFRDPKKSIMVPLPKAIDPMVFAHDPDAVSVNGDLEGQGGARFLGFEMVFLKNSLKEKDGYINLDKIMSGKEMDSLTKSAKDVRDEVKGLMTNIDHSQNDSELEESQVVNALVWFTFYKGKRHKVILANECKTVIKIEECNDNLFPIIKRSLYKTAHSWHSISVPALLEDKQRQISVALNLTMKNMKADLYPMYLYDTRRIKNRSEITSFGFQKAIGVTGNGDVRGAIQPLNKPSIRLDLVNYVLDTLDYSAQRATATPEIQQGVMSNSKRTLGEINVVSSSVDTRFGLTAKIWGWSEKEFWQIYYRLYKKHLKNDLDKKIITLAGVSGYNFRQFTKENLIAPRVDPDVFIESRAISEARRQRDAAKLNAFSTVVYANPSADVAYFNVLLARSYDLSLQDIELLFPPTIDQRVARAENKKISDNKLVPVNPYDNDQQHLKEHTKAAETSSKLAHIKAHEVNMYNKMYNSEVFNQYALTAAQKGALAQDVNFQKGMSLSQVGSGNNTQSSQNVDSQTMNTMANNVIKSNEIGRDKLAI